MKYFTKIARQWSTYRGAFVSTGAAFGLAAISPAAEVIDQVFLLGTLAIGLYDTVKDGD